jgi:hypothetical protein
MHQIRRLACASFAGMNSIVMVQFLASLSQLFKSLPGWEQFLVTFVFWFPIAFAANLFLRKWLGP